MSATATVERQMVEDGPMADGRVVTVVVWCDDVRDGMARTLFEWEGRAFESWVIMSPDTTHIHRYNRDNLNLWRAGGPWLGDGEPPGAH